MSLQVDLKVVSYKWERERKRKNAEDFIFIYNW